MPSEPTEATPEPGEVWRHHSGRCYYIVAVTNRAAIYPGWPVQVVYRDADGEVWSRPVAEFLRSCVRVEEPTC